MCIKSLLDDTGHRLKFCRAKQNKDRCSGNVGKSLTEHAYGFNFLLFRRILLESEQENGALWVLKAPSDRNHVDDH